MKTKIYLFFSLSILFLFISSSCSAYITTEVFQKYPNPIFVETGSFNGDGIDKALEAGFREIHSIELSPTLYHYCCQRFEGNPHVHLYLGDSSKVLKKVLSKINRPITFWLDGHYSWAGTARGDTNTPLLNELAIIARHPIKTHTILINDVRQFGTIEFDFIEKMDAVLALKKINPDYKISYENGYIPNDVLVASFKNTKSK